MHGTAAERATLLIAVGSSSVAFMVAFNLGAFGEIFFDQLFTVWIASTIVFVGSLVSKQPPNSWPGRLVLLLPSMWIIAAWIDNLTPDHVGDNLLFWITVVVTIVALPFVAWILVSTINPDFAELPRSNKVTVGIAVGVFFLVGLGMGARNDAILTCNDFKVSGNDLPGNCLVVSSSTSSPPG